MLPQMSINRSDEEKLDYSRRKQDQEQSHSHQLIS